MSAAEVRSYAPLPLHAQELADALEARRPHVQGEEPGDAAFRGLVDALLSIEAMPEAAYSPRAVEALHGLTLRAVVLARRLLEARDRSRLYATEGRR